MSEDRFTAEFELSVSPHQAAAINKRLDAGRQVYNAFLGEALRRHRLYVESRLYQRARRIPKTAIQARREAFKAAREDHNWSELGLKFELQRWGQQFTKSWLNGHVDSQIVKKLAERAARTVFDYSLGRKGRPRFRRKGEMTSLDGINNKQSIMVKTDEAGGLYILWGAGRGAERLQIPLIIKPHDPYHHHALTIMQPEAGFPGLKFTRIVRREIRGRQRFFAQLVLVGQPYKRDQLQRTGVVGLDLGPSTIAIVAEGVGEFSPFCGPLANKERQLRRLQRRLDRQRRANNPHCFDEKGRWIKGRRATQISNRMRQTLAKIRTLHQQTADHRKALHGQLVRQVLALGDDVRLEKVSYKSFQRNFGRSVGFRAPGTFVAHLRRKAAELGVTVTEFSTYRTRLSQTCHGCGAIRKKPLSQRLHICECGVRGHRDRYSAYLARYVENDQLNLEAAARDWPRFAELVA